MYHTYSIAWAVKIPLANSLLGRANVHQILGLDQKNLGRVVSL